MPRNKYPEETVNIILEAAMKLFAEKGYESTTILDIVAHMKGLTRGAFYHHFKSKEDVLLALNERLFARMSPFEAVKKQNGLNGLAKIKWVMRHMHGDKEFAAMQLELAPLLESPAMLKRQVDSIRDNMAPLLCPLIEEGMADGSIQARHPKLTAEAFFLLCSLWPIPASFPTQSEEEDMQKLELIAGLTAYLGLPVFDDEFMGMIAPTHKDGGISHE